MFKRFSIVFIFLCTGFILIGQPLKKAFQIAEVQSDVIVKNESNVNSPALDFSPTYLENGIVFPSARYTAGKRDKKINTTFFELFYADLDPNQRAYKPQPFSIELNSTLHEGPVCFSRDGSTIFFTRNNSDKGFQRADKTGVTRLKIFTAQRGVFDWENITELSFNNDEYSCVHPTLDQLSGRLYFSSNMPGGFGGYDLYYVDLENNQYGNPVNLGSAINSPRNELFPFFHAASQQLFFSSNGFEGLGNLDLYMIASDSYKSGPVVNVGVPFNSEADDLGIIVNDNGTNGFFSSNRKGGIGEDDIYSFDSPIGIFGRTRPVDLPMLISTYDKSTGYHLQNVELRIFEKRGDQYFYKDKSLFEAMLIPSDESEKTLIFKSKRTGLNNLSTTDLRTREAGDIKHSFLSQHQHVILASKPGYEILEYPFSTMTLPKDTSLRLAMVPKDCQRVNGQVKSSLSGGALPNAIVKVVSKIDGSEQILTTNNSGAFNVCLKAGETFSITTYKDGFSPSVVSHTGDITSGSKQVTLVMNPSQPKVAEGSVIILENIYYDFNKYNIRSSAAGELEELSQMMRLYPSMEILLTAHTDVRGKEKYNLELSISRARSAKAFLVARGINSERIKIAGRGESQPRNHCQNGVVCSDKEHAFNRRTDVLITKLQKEVGIRYQVTDPK